MNEDKLFSDEIIQRFENFSSKLFTIKHSMDFFFDYLENESDIPLNAHCVGLTIKEYLNNAKEEYNKLEEDLGLFS